ncbi:radical SAM protein [Treponema primitia]|uniref:radical SAM protein n=1 Tax=Treponema primitia TaxID=88058 RepID=UPI0039818190
MDIETANRIKSLTHPCYNGCGGKNTRIHMPVAPLCNIQCNYCIRKFNCVNESRPGVTANVLSPTEALTRYSAVKQRLGKLDVVGIAGPGDALANFEPVKETFSRIRELDENVTFCVSTNGLLLPHYAEELAKLGVSHVTVTINASEPSMGRRIYRHIDYQGKRYTGLEAATILLKNQYEGIGMLKKLGIICKVNTVLLKGLNDELMVEISQKVKNAGAEVHNIMQLIPVEGTLFESMPLVSNDELNKVRRACETIIPQMFHCRQCRADAIGSLDDDISYEFTCGSDTRENSEGSEALPDEPGLLFAAASKNGVVVDQHFGHATGFFVYEYKNGQTRFVERREVSQYCTPQEGQGGIFLPRDHEGNMEAILDAIGDCAAVIALRIGDYPRRLLADHGIECFITFSSVSEAVQKAAEMVLKRSIVS